MTFAAENPGQDKLRVAGQIHDVDESMVDLRCSVAVIDDGQVRTRTVEVVFLGSLLGPASGRALTGEPGAEPEWVPRSWLPELDLKPPIGGHLPAVMHPNHSTAPYLGNLWKPEADAVADGSAGRWRRWVRGRP